MSFWRSAKRVVADHPVAAFLIIGNGVSLASALTPPLVEAEVLPFDLPLFGSLGTILGVGPPAVVVTAATDGRAGVDDLVRRSVRWRVPGAVVSARAPRRPRRGDARRNRDLWHRCVGIAGRRLDAGAGGRRRGLRPAVDLLPTCGGDWLDRLPPGQMAGPI